MYSNILRIAALCLSLLSTVLSAETTVTPYFDGRDGAMALNYDTELYMAGMIHSNNGYNPSSAATRAQATLDGWPNIIQDCEMYGIPVSFNICGHEAVFGDAGVSEISEIDVFHSWHSDPHWAANTWYSDMPTNGGDYLTIGNLSGYTRSYELIYGGLLTEQTMNSDVPFEISYHNFGHESLSNISETNLGRHIPARRRISQADRFQTHRRMSSMEQ